MLTFSGIQAIYERVFYHSVDKTPFEYIGIGLGKSPVSVYDTQLEYEISRQKADIKYIPTSRSIRLSTVFPPGDTEGYISEIGIFNSDSINSSMLARIVLDIPKYKSRSNSFPVQWRLTL